MQDDAIIVKGVYKDFKLFYDKANTLKEKILFFKKRDKNEIKSHVFMYK